MGFDANKFSIPTFFVAMASAIVICTSLMGASAQAQMAVKGSFDVTDGGSASYSIKIPAPPGVAGLQPHLALAYNSQGGNGLLGIGWSISGLSSISRCPRTVAQDGAGTNGKSPGGIHFDANDKLCLDGQRLFPVTSTSSQGGQEFRTELEGFRRVIGFGADPSNPDWIQVEGRDGLVSEYGHTTDSRLEAGAGATVYRQWALNAVHDRLGNRLDVTYYKDVAAGDFRPKQIDWNWQSDGVSNGANVVFVYEARPDVVESYTWGVALKNAYRISEIDTNLKLVAGGSRVITSYQLSYTMSGPLASAALQTSTLTSISVCAHGSTSTSCLLPVQLVYNSGVAAGTDVQIQQVPFDTAPWVYSQGTFTISDALNPGDFFSDGVDGLLVTPSNRCQDFGSCWSGWRLYQNTPGGLTLASQDVGPDTVDPSKVTAQKKILVGDFLGDGKSGFLALLGSNNWLSGGPFYQLYLRSGNGFVVAAQGTNIDSDQSYVILGDFLGTGQIEVLVANKKDTGQTCTGTGDTQTCVVQYNHNWKMMRYDPSSGALAVIGSGTDFPGLSEGKWRLTAATFQGDGSTEILVTSDPDKGCGSPLASAGWKLYSFDGSTMQLVTSGTDSFNESDLIPGNFNGDGKAGLFVIPYDFNPTGMLASGCSPGGVDATWNGWQLWTSTGQGFVHTDTGTSPSYKDQFVVGDFNGSGRDGILTTGDALQQNYTLGWRLLGSDGSHLIQSANGDWPSNGEAIMQASMVRHSGSAVVVTPRFGYVRGTTQKYTGPWSGWKVFDTNWQQPRLMLTSISNGQTQTSIGYAALNSSPAVHQPSTGSVFPIVDVNNSMPVVTSITIPDGLGGVLSNTYSYAGLKADVSGRGLLGFATMTSYQVDYDLSTMKSFSQVFPITGAVIRLQGCKGVCGQSGATLLSQTDTTMECWEYTLGTLSNCLGSVAPGYRFFIYAKTQSVQKWDLDTDYLHPNGTTLTALPTITTTSDFDTASGNEVRKSIISTDGYQTIIERIYNNDFDNWLLGRLTLQTTKKVSP